ncbi:hypothetical protein PAXRUDRAFT_645923 [Paxillus rubicundulus Ve08.2h10]|uniref:Uncharacterized protein n=1 Tax=Paxillus rubicundulus Ve08.2h10 TaxID=930991 RepID=A0A0D0EC47_9AGAM|nr:hypothetical protein PAXRUDRAFT_645923 [Paxillus rubicundulus Ve08.2h10]
MSISTLYIEPRSNILVPVTSQVRRAELRKFVAYITTNLPHKSTRRYLRNEGRSRWQTEAPPYS